MYLEIGQEILLKSLRSNNDIYECNRCQKSLLMTTSKTRRLLYLSSLYHQICELAPNILNESATTVAILNIKQLQKVKIKKDTNTVTMEFKNNKIFTYEMGPESMKAFLDSVKESVESLGMEAVQQHKPVSNRLDTELLRSYLRVVKKLEAEFALLPSIDLVTELMNILRQTVELSSELRIQTGAAQIDQQQFQQIVFYIQQFLRRDDVLALIDSSYNTSSKKVSENPDVTLTDIKLPDLTNHERSVSEDVSITEATSPRTEDETDEFVINNLFQPLEKLVVDVNQYSLNAEEDYRLETLESPPLLVRESSQIQSLKAALGPSSSPNTAGRGRLVRPLSGINNSQKSLVSSPSWMDDEASEFSTLSGGKIGGPREKVDYKFESIEQATEHLSLMLQSMEKELHDITEAFTPLN